jgi:hypothetical protein
VCNNFAPTDDDAIIVDGGRRVIKVSEGYVKIGCTTVSWGAVDTVQRAIQRWKDSPKINYRSDR